MLSRTLSSTTTRRPTDSRANRLSNRLSAALHVTNGDCAADLMREAGIPGEVMPWRDVLHDGPVPGDLSLAELSRVRASYLSAGTGVSFSELAQEFVARDTLL